MNRSLNATELLRSIIGAAAVALVCGPIHVASAADAAAEPESAAWDVAFGAKLTSDYVDRGYSNSDGKPALQGYVELTAFDWVYAGVWASSVRYPANRDLTDPAAEIAWYGGVRHSWDAFSLDTGAAYYLYPRERMPYPGAKETDYYELGAKPSYVLGETLTLAGQAFWSGDYANTGSNATYLSVGAKLDLSLPSAPDVGAYVSAELGHQHFGRTSDGFDPADYVAWNAGIGVTYKAATLDLRYSGSDLSRSECLGVSGARGWCGHRVFASLSFDTSLAAFK